MKKIISTDALAGHGDFHQISYFFQDSMKSMLFSSPIFLFLFLPLTFALYFSVPRKRRNALLLLGSLFFYTWGESKYVMLLVASVIFNYLFGLGLGRSQEPWQRKQLIALAVAVNLSFLFFCKYSNFVVDNLNIVLSDLAIRPLHLEPIHLILGISFFTFHSLSYLIDIYWRVESPQKEPVNFGLYIVFYDRIWQTLSHMRGAALKLAVPPGLLLPWSHFV